MKRLILAATVAALVLLAALAALTLHGIGDME